MFLGPGAASLFLLVITAPSPSALLYIENTNRPAVVTSFSGILVFGLGCLVFSLVSAFDVRLTKVKDQKA